ncbi:MAG: NUDIX domain-containing protein [Halieaceae bacterium]
MSTPEPRTAATVILVRDSDAGPEVLLLKRNKALLFAGGVWVFPGGALDPEDWTAAADDEERAARVAAAREAGEEAGLLVDPDTMVQLSHWTTPVAEPKRFYTWFFLALAPAQTSIEIDGSEIHDYQWIGIAEAVRLHEAGELGLYPPTIMTLRALLGYLSAEDAMIGIAARQPYQVFPVFAQTRDPVQVLFAGDSGYESGEADEPGPRHRAQLIDKSWHYIFENQADGQSRLDS